MAPRMGALTYKPIPELVQGTLLKGQWTNWQRSAKNYSGLDSTSTRRDVCAGAWPRILPLASPGFMVTAGVVFRDGTQHGPSDPRS